MMYQLLFLNLTNVSSLTYTVGFNKYNEYTSSYKRNLNYVGHFINYDIKGMMHTPLFYIKLVFNSYIKISLYRNKDNITMIPLLK